MDLGWNTASAEQVRAETEKALREQAGELRDAADRFNQRADELDAQANAIQATLPIMRSERRTYSYTDCEGRDRTGSYTVQVIDSAATSAATARMNSLRAQAREIRRVAREFVQAAGELEAGIALTNNHFRQMHQEVQEIDRSYAHKLQDTVHDINAYIKKMEDLASRLGASISTDPDACALDRIRAILLESTLLDSATIAELAGERPTCAYAGDPINMSTGNFVYSKEDITVPGRYPLSFNRFYNAIDGTNSVLGANWTHNFNIALYAEEPFAYITFADGHVETFENIGDNTYVAQLGNRKDLIRQDDCWALVSQDMVAHYFDIEGKLHRICDPNGNTTELFHENDLLVRVSTQSGQLNITYDSNSHISTLSDHTGRTVTFEYENNHLIKVTHPTGAAHQYSYDNKGRIKEVTNPLGIVTINNEYDSNSRTTKQYMPDGSIMEYVYNDNEKTTAFIDQKGTPVVYKRDENYRTVQISYIDGSDEHFGYNDKNHRIYQIDRNKNKWNYEYDVLGNVTKVIDPLGNEISTEYNDFNKPTVITAPNGGQIISTYDNSGNITAITDPLGRQMGFSLDTFGKITTVTLPDASENKLEYDDYGNITTITDSQGATTRYEYDNLNQVVKSTDGNGVATIYEYNTKGDISKVTDAFGNTRAYEYNLAGKVVKVTDLNGSCIRYKYNNMGKVEEIIDPQGGTTTLAYDKVWNVTSVTDPLGNTTKYQYDQNNRITKTIDQEGNETKYRHDFNGNVVSVTTPLGAETIILYDALNRQKKVIEPDNATTAIEYDAVGNITKTTDALGNVTEYEYDLANQLTQVTDPTGNKTFLTYTALGKVEHLTNAKGDRYTYSYYPGGKLKSVSLPCGEIESYTYDKNGNIKTVTDALGNKTTLTYDSLNRVTATTDPLGHSKKFDYDAVGNITKIVDENGNATQYKYSLLGDVIEVTDATGRSTHYSYDAVQRLTKLKQYNSQGEPQIIKYEHNKKGEVIAVTSPLGDIANYTYDGSGNVKTITDAMGNISTLEYDNRNRVTATTNALGCTKHFQYNAMGRVTHVTDENGNTTEYKYSPQGSVTEIIDAMGHSTIYGYDALQQLTELNQFNALGEVQVTTYERNEKGEVVAVTSPLGEIVRYSYDNAGNLVSKQDEDNLTTLYSYNKVNQLTKVAYADGKTVELSYNPLKQLTEMRDWLGITTIELDQLGRATKVTDHNGNEVGYAYNAVGQREKLTYPDGKEVRYEYTPAGSLSKVIAGADTTTYTYDPLGRISERILPDNTKTKYELNPLGALVSLTHSKGSDILDDFKYIYDPVGNITQIEKHRKDIETDNGIFKYSYDPLNRLTKATNSTGSSKQYSYDPLGNRVGSNINGVETRHTFNARNQLIQTLEGDNITDYLYDKRGNLTQQSVNGHVKSSYTFDATNMLVAATTQGKGTAEYTYNGFRNRVAKLENYTAAQTTPGISIPDPTKEIRYVLDMTRPYDNLLMTQGTQEQSFIWGNSLLSATGEDNAQNFHYLQDHLGSPIRLLGDDNQPMSYDEFGVPEVTAGIFQPFGFTGYQTDDVTGLNYAQARFYSPATSRFISEDIVRHGLNYYLYCRANPMRRVDKNGLWDDEVHYYMTKDWAQEMGFSYDMASRIGTATYAADDLLGGYSFLPWFLGGNQAIHFNRDNIGDSRERISTIYLNRAINTWNSVDENFERRMANAAEREAIYADAFAHRPFQDQFQAYIEIHDMRYVAENLRRVEQAQAMRYLGIALHALQDIPAHGQIDAGRWGIFGHTSESMASNQTLNNLLNAQLSAPCNRTAAVMERMGMDPALIPLGPNPDSPNYMWVPGSETQLMHFDGDPQFNPRILDTRDLTSRLLYEFARETGVTNITRLPRLDCPVD